MPKLNTVYDIGAAFEAIENELISSMIRNMRRHKLEEIDEDKQWAMWQALQLKALEKYKKDNQKKYGKQFKDINAQIKALISISRTEGEMAQEIAILEAIRNGFPAKRIAKGAAAEFFKLNDRKLEALIKATMDDMEQAEIAVLRMATKERHTVEIKVFGGAYEIDRVIANMGGIVSEVELQQAQKIKAAQALFNDTFINGDTGVDSKCFDGLDKALTGSSTEYNADGVIDLSTSELVTKNYQYFLDMLDEFLGGLDGTPTFIGGNNKLISKLRACARRASMYQVTKDNWGNQVESYGGIPFVDLKTKPGTNDEVVPIESSDGKTSLYVARLAMDGLHAVSFAGVAPVQTWLPDFSTAGAVKKGEVEMNAAIALKTSKAAGVFRGIKVK